MGSFFRHQVFLPPPRFLPTSLRGPFSRPTGIPAGWPLGILGRRSCPSLRCPCNTAAAGTVRRGAWAPNPRRAGRPGQRAAEDHRPAATVAAGHAWWCFPVAVQVAGRRCGDHRRPCWQDFVLGRGLIRSSHDQWVFLSVIIDQPSVGQLGFDRRMMKGNMGMGETSKWDLRLAAHRRCQHCCRLYHQRGGDHPHGRQDLLAAWCAGHLGPRWVDWYYRGGGVWCFADQEDLVAFQLTWLEAQ